MIFILIHISSGNDFNEQKYFFHGLNGYDHRYENNDLNSMNIIRPWLVWTLMLLPLIIVSISWDLCWLSSWRDCVLSAGRDDRCSNKSQSLGQRSVTMAGVHKAARNYHSGKWYHWGKRLSLVARFTIRWSCRWWNETHCPIKQHSPKEPSNGNNSFAFVFLVELLLLSKTDCDSYNCVVDKEWAWKQNAKHQANCKDHFKLENSLHISRPWNPS